MAKGINQDFKTHLTELESSSLLELFAIYYNYSEDNQEIIYVHSSNNNGILTPIVFNGQEYLPIALETDGFEVLGNQKLPRPKIKFSNAGMYFSSLLRKYDNLNKAKVIRKRTFAKFLDDVNFPNSKNPFGSANPDAVVSEDKFFVNRKISENKLFVELELVSSLELENVYVPSRTIGSNYCPFVYRGEGCLYGYESETTGDGLDRPIATLEDNNFVIQSGLAYGKWHLNPEIFPIDKTGNAVHYDGVNDGVLVAKGKWKTGQNYAVGDYVYTQSNKLELGQGVSNYYDAFPVYYVCKLAHEANSNASHPKFRGDAWVKDACSKNIHACKARFYNEDYSDGINFKQHIPFGGFPGTEKFGR